MTQTPPAASSPDEPLAPAPEIEAHAWLRPLGRGGFADVHLYRQENPPRQVAVKVLRAVDDAAGREAMDREAAALASVSGHPSIVSLYAVGETADGRAWLSMEFCPTADVSARVRERPWDVAGALDLAVQVCAGAETVHRAGYVHRDIKPGNVMLTPWRRPVLADFGAALRVGEAVTARTARFSVPWAPPEQQDGCGVAHPTQDVWALAATIWTLLVGHSPFEVPGADNAAWTVAGRVRGGDLPPLGRSDTPPDLEAALRRALVVDAASRTPSPAILAEELQAVQTKLGLPRTPVHLLDQPPPDPSAVRLRMTALAPAPVPLPPPAADPEATISWADDRTIQRAPVAPAPAASDVPGPQDPPAGRRGVRGWVVALVVAVAVVAAIAVTSALLLGQGATPRPAPPSVPSKPLDPVGAPPTPAAGLQGSVVGGRVSWTWRAASEVGVRYHVVVTRPGRPNLLQRTSAASIDVEAVAGENCAEVTVTGADGRPSDPVKACVTVP